MLNHVCLHQTVIGQEAIAQLELAGEYPDVVVGCVGGGSNFAGLAYPFMRRNLREGGDPLRRGRAGGVPDPDPRRYRYDFGDTVGLTPLMPMYTLGHDFVPPPVHAGGLRYHGDAPSLCALVKEGVVEARAIQQTAAFDAAVRFAAPRGSSPAPEPAHALRAAFDEAEAAKEAGEERVILIGLSGHGHFDMSAYDAYLAGELTDLEFSEADMEAALHRLGAGAGCAPAAFSRQVGPEHPGGRTSRSDRLRRACGTLASPSSPADSSIVCREINLSNSGSAKPQSRTASPRGGSWPWRKGCSPSLRFSSTTNGAGGWRPR